MSVDGLGYICDFVSIYMYSLWVPWQSSEVLTSIILSPLARLKSFSFSWVINFLPFILTIYFLPPSKFEACFTSVVHDEAHLEQTLDAFSSAILKV